MAWEKEKVRAYNHAYYVEHKDKILAGTAAWKKAHPDYMREYRSANADHIATTARNWAVKNREKIREYERSRKVIRSALKLKYSRACPEKNRARTTLNKAKKGGKIRPSPCVVCGDIKVEGHHPDYNNYLQVVWLCKKHHAETHRALRANRKKELSKCVH